MSALPVPIGEGVLLVDPTAALESARAYAEAATSAATRRAYASGWCDFEVWCRRYGTPSLPASPGAVAAYLASLADRDLKIATIDQRAAAIAAKHRRGGFTPPTGHEDVRRVLQGIRRTIGTAQDGKAPITADVIRKLLKALFKVAPNSLAGKRDHALMLVGFAGAFRRSELVGIHAGYLRWSDEGVEITIAKSKGDQEGRGQTVAIPNGRKLRPVAALRVWMVAAGIESGAIFRPVDKGGNVGNEALTGQSVALVVKRWAEAAGLDPDLFAGHSLRSGMITQALIDKIDVLQIMDLSRHKEVNTVKKYDRRLKSFENHAGRKSL